MLGQASAGRRRGEALGAWARGLGAGGRKWEEEDHYLCQDPEEEEKGGNVEKGPNYKLRQDFLFPNGCGEEDF